MKIKQLEYWGGSSMPFLGEYQPYERELKCTCGNTERFKEYNGTMSIIASWECTDCGSAVIPK